MTSQEPIRREFFIADDHPHFEGHFAGAPVFPAVSQMDLVIDLLSETLGERVEAEVIKRAKFKALIRPNTKVELILHPLDAQSVNWLLKAGESVLSLGVIEFVENR